VSALDKDPERIAARFSAIANSYARSNHVLSLNQDRRWRERLVRWMAPGEGSRVLDVCTGTGDLALALARRPAVEVVGVDLSEGMLSVADEKARAQTVGRVRFVQGNALELPFPDAHFDAVAVAFGLRNLPDYRRGLAERRRGLRPHGRLWVMEFALPRGLWGQLYLLYLRYVLPWVGGALTGRCDSYRYLHDSIRDFPAREALAGLVREAGFERVRSRNLSGGIAAVHRGTRLD